MTEVVKEPPLVLVKTWLGLIKSSEDIEVKQHANKMLMNAFGNVSNIAEYVKKHNLKI